MTLFCLLWVPLFCLFRFATVSVGPWSAGYVWALLLGSLTAVFQFFMGPLVDPGGFGLSRWISALVDIVALPAVLPLAVYGLYRLPGLVLRKGSPEPDIADFALLWLIPSGIYRAVSWHVLQDPVMLVLVPLLWTAIVVGSPFLISITLKGPILIKIPAVLVGAVLPFLAASSWWAFSGQDTLRGGLFLGASLLPLAASVVYSAHSKGPLKSTTSP
ncbi:MAG: hypothetical protein LBT11_06260 [Treponema sp.]|jgi:hypothetical protein|nr:hypothetical protein [Treponema sp.]